MQIDPEAAGFCADKLRNLTTHLEQQYLAPKKIAGCSIRVVRHGVTAHASTMGMMDIARGKPMRINPHQPVTVLTDTRSMCA